MEFKLTPNQTARVTAWTKTLVPNLGYRGGLSYTFTPTELGTIVKVRDGASNQTLDITEYELW